MALETTITLPCWNNPATAKGRVVKTFGEFMPRSARCNILDIGCAEGLTTEEIALANPDSYVLGIDRNSSEIYTARKNHRKGNYRVMDVFNNRLKAENFDYVFTMNNIAFGLNGKPEEVYREELSRISRLVRQNGQLLVSMNKQFGVFQRENEKYTRIGGFVSRFANPEGEVLEEIKSPIYLITKLLTGIAPGYKTIHLDFEDFEINNAIAPICVVNNDYPIMAGVL